MDDRGGVFLLSEATAASPLKHDDPPDRCPWDPTIPAIVGGSPRALATPRAEAIGHDANIDAVVQAFIEDDLPLQKQLSG